MRILWLKTELLHPVDKGGKIRTYQMLRELKKAHHITYLTLDDGTADPDASRKADEYAHEVVTVPHRTAAKFSLKFYVELLANLRSNLPYALQKYVSAEIRAKILELISQDAYDVVVSDFLASAVNMPEKRDVPTILFQHNVEGMIWRRHFEVANDPVRRALMKTQWRRMRSYEQHAARRFDSVIAVSKEDAIQMENDYGIERVSNIPTGVDTEYFRSNGAEKSDGCNLVFTGSMDWLPNEDAIVWFVRDIMPRIRNELPDVSLTVVGRNPSRTLVEMADKDPAIKVTGQVPDVRPFMNAASIYIVPIRIGGGTRLKIYEAMAMELPIVSTTIGAEGLPVQDGDDILLRDDPDAFSDAVVTLMKNQALAREISGKAVSKVRQKFGWKNVAAEFEANCQKTIELWRTQKSTPRTGITANDR